MNLAPAPASRPASSDEYRTAFVVATGVFATTLSQLEVLDLPFRQLLQVRFDASPQQTALFFAAAGAPWFLQAGRGTVVRQCPAVWNSSAPLPDPVRDPRGSFWFALGPGRLFSYLCDCCSRARGDECRARGRQHRDRRAHRRKIARVRLRHAAGVGAGSGRGRLRASRRAAIRLLAGMPFEAAAFVGAAIAFSVVPVAFFWLIEPRGSRA